ncbi:uncharacterized protein N7496_007850 [Penicillium cataractarum]|uniref:Uncharacterized protein n=1 Tax=Penicillium cataractarum TaxID=2100454 RepID=A0A9W9RXF8_9EURO|nr:uncharacterized protein N7496_007850 [Penicillium cataractarum]KAJ5368090.1 hypothetical protein N7496_007850 [Penicillium cataractarum]
MFITAMSTLLFDLHEYLGEGCELGAGSVSAACDIPHTISKFQTCHSSIKYEKLGQGSATDRRAHAVDQRVAGGCFEPQPQDKLCPGLTVTAKFGQSKKDI